MPITVTLPYDIEARLTTLCKMTGRKRDEFIAKAVVEQIEDMEDVYLASQRMKDLKGGHGKSIPLETLIGEDDAEN